MNRRVFIAAAGAAGIAGAAGAGAGAPDFTFASIDGGSIALADLRGGPVLMVNTASRCGFTPQYDGLQALFDAYRDRGLTVIGVPSDSFRQELASESEVKEFCEVNFGIEFPMTTIVPVTGPDAHPFYAWALTQGAAPSWNFHKILLDGEGEVVAEFPSVVGPDSPKLIGAIEALLPSG